MPRQGQSRNTTEAVVGKIAVVLPISPYTITGVVPELL